MSNDEGPIVPQQLISEIRKEAFQQTAKWIIGTVLVLAGLSVAGWWLYLKERLPIWFGGVPVGAVIAFDDPGGCKKLGDGWAEVRALQGKAIFGAIEGDDKWGYQQRGGNVNGKVALEARHLPASFYTLQPVHIGAGEVRQFVTDVNLDKLHTTPDGAELTTDKLCGEGVTSKNCYRQIGRGDPIDALPPYVALYYCKKEN